MFPREADASEANASSRRFKLINGVIIPGGGADLTPHHPFYEAAAQLVNLTLDANDRGDYFPVSFTIQYSDERLYLPIQTPTFYPRTLLHSALKGDAKSLDLPHMSATCMKRIYFTLVCAPLVQG